MVINCTKCGYANFPGALECGNCHAALDYSALSGTASPPLNLAPASPPEADPRREARRQQGAQEIKRGFTILLVGLVITGITYGMAAGRGGGSYVFAWGAILVGVLYIIQGLSKSG